MDDGEKGDRRTRKFAEVVTPQPEPMIKLTNRGVPTPSDLGPLQQLVGVWLAEGTGWNMIALPFQNAPAPPAGFKFRVLMNQYSEELRFDFVDDDVPNRGLSRIDAPAPDQFVVTLDYQQKIAQVAAEDRPDSGGLAGLPGLPIHHEPGLWLYEKNRRSMDDQIQGDQVSQVELKVARLASIPHGNSVLAIGTADYFEKMPKIPAISGLPAGRFEDVLSPGYDFKTDPYLEPFKHYIDNPFMGNVVGVPGFPGFSPADMNQILRFANQGVNIVKTTVLTVEFDPQERRDTQRPVLGPRGRAGQHEVDLLDPGTGRKGQVRKSEASASIFAGGHDGFLPPPRGRVSRAGRLAAYQHRDPGKGAVRLSAPGELTETGLAPASVIASAAKQSSSA